VAGSETIYTIAAGSPVVLVRGRTQVTRIQATLNGAGVSPTGTVEYELSSPGGSVVSTGSGLITIGVTGICTATVPDTDLTDAWAYGEHYQERWTLTLGSVDRTVRRLAVLGRFELHPPVSEAELVAGEYPDLAEGLGDYGTTLQPFMDAAWAECLRWLWRKGTPSDLLVDAGEVYDWYRHTVLARVFKMQSKMQPGASLEALWRYHDEQATAAKNGVAPTIDRDRTGQPDSYARKPLAQTVHVNVSPRRRIASPHKF
jgi:hypothetical protein